MCEFGIIVACGHKTCSSSEWSSSPSPTLNSDATGWCDWNGSNSGHSSFYQLGKSHKARKAFMLKWPLCSVIFDARWPLFDCGKSGTVPLKKRPALSWMPELWNRLREKEREREKEKEGERVWICGKEIVLSCVICHWMHGPELFSHFRAATCRSAGFFLVFYPRALRRSALPRASPPHSLLWRGFVLRLHLFALCAQPLTILNALPRYVSELFCRWVKVLLSS